MSGRPAYSEATIRAFKALICREAIKLVSERGIDGLSFRTLASRLGCSHTRVHRYYPNRETLLWAVRDYAYGLFMRALGEGARHAEGSVLRAIGRAYFNFAHDEPDAFVMLFGSAPPADREPGPNQRHAWKAISEPISAAVTAGHLQGDPDVLTYVFWSAIHGVTSLSLSGNFKPGVDPLEVLESTFDGLGRGHGTSR